MPDPALPTVSVVVVNYRGAEDTVTCLRALRDELDYPPGALQIICVDNDSGDGSAERIAAVEGVELVEAGANLGFAGGCNLGARHATGTVLAFLNNDARPDPGWARAAVAVLRDEPGVAAVASKVLDWDGRTIDFVDAGLTWFGMGYKRHTGEPRPATTWLATCCSRPARRCSCAPRCSASWAASTSGSSCSTRTWTSAGGATCVAGECATSPDRLPTTGITARCPK